jgi:phosphatidylglycerol lysyltransferase
MSHFSVSFPSRKHPVIEAWSIRIISMLVFAIGAINMVSAASPALQKRLLSINHFFPWEVRRDGRLAAALVGFALFLLAGSLWRRKRTAWLLTIIFLVISAGTNLMMGFFYTEAILSAGLIILLLIFHSYYHVVSDRPSARQGLIVLALAFGFTLAYGTLGLYLLDRYSSHPSNLWSAFQKTLIMFTSFYNPEPESITRFGEYFTASIYIVGAVTFSYALVMLIRPVLIRQPATAWEKKRATAIVEKYGNTARARVALFPDKSYFFSKGGSVIAFAARGRGAVALGDPIGPQEDIAATILAFKEYCFRNDWQAAFINVAPDFLDSYRAAGFFSLHIGDEAIVSLAEYNLAGSGNRNVRNSISKFQHGHRVEVHQPPLDDRLLHMLKNISDAWLTTKRGGEFYFINGWFDDDYIRNCPVFVVHAPDGKPTAFANLISEYQKNEAAIDLMRRYPEAESGTMDFLYASMLEWAKGQGYESFSLGMSAFAGVGDQPDDPRVEQALRSVSEYIVRFYNFKSLHFFKNKFHPHWEPRYLVYPGTTSLPIIISTLTRIQTRNRLLWQFFK